MFADDGALQQYSIEEALLGHGLCSGNPPSAGQPSSSAIWQLHALLLSGSGEL